MNARAAAKSMRLVVGLGVSGASVIRHLRRTGVPFAVTDSRAAPPNAELAGDAPRAFGGFASPVPIAQLAEAILSPGVSPDEPFVRELRAAGVPVCGDIELFARALAAQADAHPRARPPQVIGITGSNGKSTTTTLVGEMARAAQVRVAVGGNLGEAALDLLDPQVELYVLELSSFQLETTHTLACTAATVLNLSEDHLDRHGSMAAYAEAKSIVFRGAHTAVVNRDDLATHRNVHCARRIVSFGLDVPEEGHYGLAAPDGERWLAFGGLRLAATASLRIHGLHNAANALAALALAEAAGIPRAAQLSALLEFRGLRHRCEWVAERRAATWFNDSKGTNVGATLAALSGLDGPIVWLGGGQGKGQDFAPLRAPLARKGRSAIVFGQDAGKLATALAGAVPVATVSTLDEAVAKAGADVQPGDQVLLSPACASLDQFRNYEERGDRFADLVRRLPS